MRQQADAPYRETEHTADCQHEDNSTKTHDCAAMGLSPGPPLLDDLEYFLLCPMQCSVTAWCINEAAQYARRDAEC